MNLYRAIIWGTILIIIVEGVTLSGFNIYSISSEYVLGERTIALLEEVKNRSFPATYYVELDTQQQVKEVLQPQGEELKKKETMASDVVEEKENPIIQDKAQNQTTTEEVNDVINALNTVGAGLDGTDNKQDNRGVSVDELIRKNKRIYHEDIKKALDKISESFNE